jgi:hypothetical protein
MRFTSIALHHVVILIPLDLKLAIGNSHSLLSSVFVIRNLSFGCDNFLMILNQVLGGNYITLTPLLTLQIQLDLINALYSPLPGRLKQKHCSRHRYIKRFSLSTHRYNDLLANIRLQLWTNPAAFVANNDPG